MSEIKKNLPSGRFFINSFIAFLAGWRCAYPAYNVQ